MAYNIPGVQTFEFSKIIGIENIQFGSNIIIDDFTFIYATSSIVIGNYVHIACFSSISGGAPIVINDFAAISQGARILSGTDDFVDWGFGNSTVPNKYRNVAREPVNISKFCIIGANSVILPGVNIGEGAVVGANSIVSKNLDPWGVYVSNGKRIRDRNKSEVMNTYSKFLREENLSLDDKT